MASVVQRIPNWLTVLRVALIPLFVLLLLEPTTTRLFAATVVFVVAAITDWVDGFIARRFGATSSFGKLLDPLADKILVMTALVMLVGLRDERYGDSFLPAWMVVLVLAREFWVTGLRGLAATEGLIMGAQMTGKLKSALQMVAIVFLLLHDLSLTILASRFTCQYIGLNILMVSIVLSYVSAVDYSREVLAPVGGNKGAWRSFIDALKPDEIVEPQAASLGTSKTDETVLPRE